MIVEWKEELKGDEEDDEANQQERYNNTSGYQRMNKLQHLQQM